VTDIIQLKKGDLVVFNEVYEKFHKPLYCYLLKKTSSAFFAEEITQTTFIKLWRYRESLNEDISLDAQIFRIAKTAFIDQMRQLSGARKAHAAFIKRARSNEVFNDGLQSVQEKEILGKLQNALSRVTPMQRKVFELSRVYQLSHKEIGVQQSISTKTVENHINQALKKIKGSFVIVFSLLFH